VDSFGAVRDDWLIKAAGRTYRGQAELWALPGVVYKVEIDAGFTKKDMSIATRYPSETLIVNIENSYLVLNYLQPPARVYILGQLLRRWTACRAAWSSRLENTQSS
jgi:hypothetical protein